jgi:hypothetical protein
MGVRSPVATALHERPMGVFPVAVDAGSGEPPNLLRQPIGEVRDLSVDRLLTQMVDLEG